MQNIDQKCEMCSMQSTHTESDIQNGTHYFCEHHSLNSTKGDTKNSIQRLVPLFDVLTGIALVSSFRQISGGPDPMLWMMDFMGIFFLIFGLFKLYDIKGFVRGFQTYDMIAKKIPAFAYSLPFIEIILGGLYLAGFMFLWQNLVALTLAGLGIYSAYAVIKKKKEVQCVCLGTAFNLPMTNVTLIENGIMFIMVLFMLVM